MFCRRAGDCEDALNSRTSGYRGAVQASMNWIKIIFSETFNVRMSC
jgi:hypothetical protein